MKSTLSAKQQIVCDLVTEGWSTKEIARHLRVSPRMIETHRREIYLKLDVRNAIELTRKVAGAR